jgi:5-methylcytosine-specific restriction endonuclease McrA
MHTRWLDHDALRVTFELPAEVWALLERALEGARQRAATPLADAEALAAVVRDALASQNQAADASEVELAREGRGIQRGGPLPAAIRRAVLLRDRCRCRVPGCSRRRYVDVHHLVARAEGGDHSRSNCITLCSTHHRRLHEGKLLITGDADAEPVFQDSANQRVTSFGQLGVARSGARPRRRMRCGAAAGRRGH